MASSGKIAMPIVSSGVQQDMHLLLNKFKALESLKLEDFTSVFRELRFDTILHHRITPAEHVQHAEFVLQQAANYFRDQDNFSNRRSVAERVFGIYLVYALFHTQPKDYVCKAKVTLTQMAELLELEKLLTSKQHLDAVVCLHVLLTKQAFQLSVFQSDYDPNYHKTLMDQDESWKHAQKDEPFKNIELMIGSDVFLEMDLLHRSYLKGKKQLNIDANYIDSNRPIICLKEIIKKHKSPPLDTPDSNSHLITFGDLQRDIEAVKQSKMVEDELEIIGQKTGNHMKQMQKRQGNYLKIFDDETPEPSNSESISNKKLKLPEGWVAKLRRMESVKNKTDRELERIEQLMKMDTEKESCE